MSSITSLLNLRQDVVFNKKNVLTPSIIHWWRGGYGFYHTQGEFPDVWALSEDLRSDIDTVFVSKHYDGFFCVTKEQKTAKEIECKSYLLFYVKIKAITF